MARSVEDLRLVSRLVFGIQGNEQSIAPIPYRQIQLPPKLRFGYYTSGPHLLPALVMTNVDSTKMIL
ncbi:hypothetical protein C0992_004918 [Termitomyces sp. T32_za158]|nr:hypothetical protein C0992_004918 [Termitomyces sp. T32_za158]